jgi:hypothetical protein
MFLKDSSLVTRAAPLKAQCTPLHPNPHDIWDFGCDDQYPTYAEIVQHVRDHGVVETPSIPLFYSLWGDVTNHMIATSLVFLKYWVRVPNPAHYADAVDALWYNAQEDHIRNVLRQPMYPMAVCISQAIAELNQADRAYVTLGPEGDFDTTTVWFKTEFPALTQNPHVKNIYRLDTTNMDRVCVETIWTRDVDDEFGLTESCRF